VTLFALSTGHTIGLGLVALAFIVFALVSAMVIPRSRPDFPRNVGGFVALTFCFFAVMLFAVFYFGRESHAGNEALGVTATTTVPGGPATHTGVTQTATTPKQEAPPTTTGAGKAALSEGKSIFQQNCAACHTLKDAGASGTVGPNLDQLKPPQQKVITQVTNGGAIMPSFKQRLSSSQIQAVAAYVSSVAGAS
jgi:mono/diheme cytochrome c family protein